MRWAADLRDVAWATTAIVVVFVLFYGPSYVPGMSEAISEFVAVTLVVLAVVIDRLTRGDRGRRSRSDA
jgi:hypothetical protein